MQHITTLTLTLEPSNSLEMTSMQANSPGPYLQGVLMEHTDSVYAESLHRLAFNPYSQYCYKDEDSGNLVWRINALTDEAAEQIVNPMLKADSVDVRSLGATFGVVKKTTETVCLKSLLDLIHEKNETKPKVRFITPAAFKSQGEYIIIPTVRLMLQNLLMHYSQVYEGDKEIDGETIAYINQHVRIVSYNLRSRYYAHVIGGHRKIPAFVGTITLNVGGPQTMSGLVRMLLKFGEYAGLGIKTSMGMGGIKCS